MADYIEITDYTDFRISSSNVPKLMEILEEHIKNNPELADELGISLDAKNFEPEDFLFNRDDDGNIVSIHLDGKEISDCMEKMFIAITPVVMLGSRIVWLNGKLYGYEWGFEHYPDLKKLEKVLRKVSYSITPELISILS